MSSYQENATPTIVPPEDHDTTALVTGAAGGLGLEVARQLADAGVRVFIAARDAQKAADAAAGIDGVSALPVGLDVTDAASVAAAAQAIGCDSGRLDILVNNAAAAPDVNESVLDADLATSAKTLEVDVLGTWRVIQEFLPLLRESAHPRVVNVGSGTGSFADPDYGIAVYGGLVASHGVAKVAENALTVAFAAALADTPVIVNAVCPDVTASYPDIQQPPGARSVADSAPSVIRAAFLPDDGPRGGFFRDGRPLAW